VTGKGYGDLIRTECTRLSAMRLMVESSVHMRLVTVGGTAMDATNSEVLHIDMSMLMNHRNRTLCAWYQRPYPAHWMD
jgi:hypothetical protein